MKKNVASTSKKDIHTRKSVDIKKVTVFIRVEKETRGECMTKKIQKLGLKIFNPNYLKFNKSYIFKANNVNLQNLNSFLKKMAALVIFSVIFPCPIFVR